MRAIFRAPTAIVIGASIALFTLVGPIDLAGPIIAVWGLACALSLLRPPAEATGSGRHFSIAAGTTLGLITLGTAVRGIHGILLDSDPPLVSPADFVHVPGYLGLVYLAWFLYRSRITRRHAEAWLDAAAIALVIILVLWTTILGTFLGDTDLGLGASLLNAFYNTAVLTALVIALRITATPGVRPRAYYILGVGYFVGFVADIATTVAIALDGTLTVSIALAPLAVGLVAAAVNDPTAPGLTLPHHESEERVSPWRTAIVSMAAFGPIVLLFAPDDAMTKIGAALLVIALALVLNIRIIRLLKKHQQVAEMDRLLALEIAGLSQLSDPGEIQAALPRAFDTVIGPDVVNVDIKDRSDNDEIDISRDVSYSISERHQGGPAVSRIVDTLIREADLLASNAVAAAKYEQELREIELRRGAAQSEQRFQALGQNAADAVFVLDAWGVVTYVSPSIEGMMGWTPSDFLGKTMQWCLHKNDRQEGVDTFVGVLKSKNTHHIEFRLMTKEGEPLLMSCVFTYMMDVETVEGIVINITDVTDQRMLESSLRNAELFDPLTLLFNRSTFIEEVTSAIRASTFTQTEVVVTVINIDDFRILNEGMGTEIGDQVLIETAARIRRHLRVGDMVARLSGDEFGVLMTVEHNPEQLAEPIDRILASIAEPMTISGHEISVNATAGLAIDTDGSSTGLGLMRNADTAVDTAKESQRGSVVVFDEAMGEEISRRMQIRNRLGSAIENEELRLAYQPITDIETGEIVSLEALARWTDDSLGVVPPGVFITVAERTGMILQLGDWALRCACQQIVAWDKVGLSGFSVSVNMSADQLRSSEIVQDIARILATYEVHPDRLTIEITESMLLDDTELISGRIQEIRALGVKLSIDDFGTGYSSLSYLRKYEFDVLKIDRGFVVPLGDDNNRRDRQIVKNMITLAQDLDAITVAEGIENQSEFDVLQSLGCDRAQGFLLWKPLEVAEATEVLSAQHAQTSAA